MGVLKNKHLIGLENTVTDDIQKLIDTGFTFREVLDRPIKKVPSLTGKNIVTFFLSIPLAHVFPLNLLKKDYRQMSPIFLPALPALVRGRA